MKPAVARKQLDAEKPKDAPSPVSGPDPDGPSTALTNSEATGVTASPAASMTAKRFHGSVPLDPSRLGRDAGRIGDEVVAHLAGLVGAKVRVTIEIEAEFPEGVSEQVVRTVTENSRTLKLTSHGFETD